jgi:ABC-type multidrug transport system ATPase subunit
MTLNLSGTVCIGSFTLRTEIAAENEIIAITGANGVGKTTLLRLLAGIINLTTGSLLIDGVTYDDATTDIFIPAN